MRIFKRISAAAIVCAGLATGSTAWAATTGVVQSYDTYKSWLVACDNTLVCVAKGVSESEPPAEIRITRQPGGAGDILMEIRSGARFTLGDVRIDGKPVVLAKSSWRIASDHETTTATSHDLSTIRTLVGQLRNAEKLAIGKEGDVQLDGFAAAILRLDDRQGRIGGVTSIARPGPTEASRVTPGPSTPRIPARPITESLASSEALRLISLVRSTQKSIFAKEDCQSDIHPMETEAYALDARRAIVFIPCLMGAYQGSSLAFIADRNGTAVRRLTAPAPFLGRDPHESVVDEFTESEFDPKTGMLTIVAKGRGLADCGFSASWIWNGQTMVLISMTYQDACGGVEAGDWPTLFRSVQ